MWRKTCCCVRRCYRHNFFFQCLEFLFPWDSVVYGVSIKLSDLETTTSEMTSSNECAWSNSRADPLSPCVVQTLSTRFDNQQRDVKPLGWNSSSVVIFQVKKTRESLVAVFWQEFLVSFRSGQGKRRVPDWTHKAAFLTAHSACLTDVAVLLLLLCLNYVNNLFISERMCMGILIPVVQCLSSFALLPVRGC
jgi:hypothetical protein